MKLLLTSAKRVDRKSDGKTADRMYDIFLFHAHEMLNFSILRNSVAIFTLVVKIKE